MNRTALILALAAMVTGCISDPVRPKPPAPVEAAKVDPAQTSAYQLFPAIQSGASVTFRLKTNAVLTDMTTAFYVYPKPQFSGLDMWLSDGGNRIASGSPLAVHSATLKPSTTYELHVQNMTGQPLRLGVGWVTVGDASRTWVFNPQTKME